jgi:peptidoglycan/xylan/chitin deacetylase (PgdA/CDA1 family)
LAASAFGLLGAAGALTGGALVGNLKKAPAPVVIPTPRAMDGLRQHPGVVAPPQLLPYHFAVPQLERRSPRSVMSGLPGDGNLVALTVDDGGSSEVVAAYARWVAETGMRVTFFLNGSLPAWTEQAPLLAPLIASGHVQLANHTWSHLDLTTASDQQIVDDLMTNEEFIMSTYGVSAKPYYRPPFGRYDDRVLAAAASAGSTSCVMWYGSLADSGLISESELLLYAETWLQPQHIVIGHANHLPVTNLFPQLTGILRDRNLQPVTLDDVFSR